MYRLLIPFLLILSLSCTQKYSGNGSDGSLSDTVLRGTIHDRSYDADRLDEEAGIDILPEFDSTVPPYIDESITLTPVEQKALQTQPNIHFDLSDQERHEVQRFFKFFTHKNRAVFERWLKRSELYLPYVRRVFAEKGLPEELIYLPFVESGYNPRAYSRAGASGMWQFMRFTGRKFNLKCDWWIDERRDPYKATYAAAEYLSVLYDLFDDWYLALAAYNAGEGKISRAVNAVGADDFFELSKKNHLLKRRARLARETRNYVPKFLAVLKIVRNLDSLGFGPVDWNKESETVELKVKGGTDLLALTKHIGMSWKEFFLHNQAFRRYVSPPDSYSSIYLPSSKIAQAEEFLQKPGAVPYAGYQIYRVRSGDSWYRISRRFGVPISILKKLNNKRSNLIRPRERMMIPRKSLAVSTPRERTKQHAVNRYNYVVKRGDTLYDLSKQYGVSVGTLKRANGLRTGRYLRVGQKLYIPDQSIRDSKKSRNIAETLKKTLVYRVRRGDTVWSIAKKFGVNHNDLLRWNNLSRRSVIRPGDRLSVKVE